MADIINDRDNLIMSGTRTQPIILPDDIGVSGDVTGTLNGIPVQDVIDAAQSGGSGGDETVAILENSGTLITVNSSTLFQMPGSGSGGTFIGGGGIFGRNSSGVTKFSVNSQTGLLEAEDATIRGTLTAGSVITNSVTISGSGTSLQQLVDSMGSTFDLQGALDSGVSNILAGVGSNYRLHVDTANAFIALRHMNAVYNGTASSGGGIRPAVGISSAGIAMGYNTNAGAWVNAVAISATGNASFAGTISASSVIANSVTISGSGTTMQQLVDGMGSTFDLQGALDAGVSNILAGVGSNYRLHVDTSNAFIALRHVNAVYNGTASSGGGIRPAVGISSAGIAMGYNTNAGAWVNSVSINSSGNATFAGTVAANSIIANSVTISGSGTTMQQLVDGMGSTFDLQGALDSGVSNIIAGVGSNYRLHVDTANGFVAFKHVNAVYNGTASSGGGIRPAVGISSAGIAMGYNTNAGAWVNAVAISATGNASFAGTISASSVIANSVTISGSGTTMQQLVDGMGSTFDLQAALNSGVSNILAGVGSNYRLHVDTSNAFIALRHVNAVYNGTAASGGGIRPAVGISSAGIAMGYNTNAGAWVNAVAIDATGNASFIGNIIGGSGIDITGSAIFNGISSGYSVRANPSGGTRGGVDAKSNSSGLPAINGQSLRSDAPGGRFTNNLSGGTALEVFGTLGTGISATGGISISGNSSFSNNLTISGTTAISGMTKSGTTQVTNLHAQYWGSHRLNGTLTGSATATFNGSNKPGSNSTNQWLRLTSIGGSHVYLPVWG